MTDLGTVEGYPFSVANGINNKGEVVGQTVTPGNTKGVGWVWEDGGPVIDLNTLVAPGSGVIVEEAFSINDRGEISANGILPNGNRHAVLLVPTE
jgi:probable HAF family extracellular repeat protein